MNDDVLNPGPDPTQNQQSGSSPSPSQPENTTDLPDEPTDDATGSSSSGQPPASVNDGVLSPDPDPTQGQSSAGSPQPSTGSDSSDPSQAGNVPGLPDDTTTSDSEQSTTSDQPPASVNDDVLAPGPDPTDGQPSGTPTPPTDPTDQSSPTQPPDSQQDSSERSGPTDSASESTADSDTDSSPTGSPADTVPSPRPQDSPSSDPSLPSSPQPSPDGDSEQSDSESSSTPSSSDSATPTPEPDPSGPNAGGPPDAPQDTFTPPANTGSQDSTSSSDDSQPQFEDQQGIEVYGTQGSRVYEQARSLEQEIVQNNENITDVRQVRIEREGDRLVPELTEAGAEEVAANQLSDRFSTDLDLTDVDVSGDTVELTEGGTEQVRESILDQTADINARAGGPDLGLETSPDASTTEPIPEPTPDSTSGSQPSQPAGGPPGDTGIVFGEDGPPTDGDDQNRQPVPVGDQPGDTGIVFEGTDEFEPDSQVRAPGGEVAGAPGTETGPADRVVRPDQTRAENPGVRVARFLTGTTVEQQSNQLGETGGPPGVTAPTATTTPDRPDSVLGEFQQGLEEGFSGERPEDLGETDEIAGISTEVPEEVTISEPGVTVDVPLRDPVFNLPLAGRELEEIGSAQQQGAQEFAEDVVDLDNSRPDQFDSATQEDVQQLQQPVENIGRGAVSLVAGAPGAALTLTEETGETAQGLATGEVSLQDVGESVGRSTGLAGRSATERPFYTAGAVATGFATGTAATRGASSLARAGRSFRTRQRADATVQFEDVTSERGAEGDLPQFRTDPSESTDRAVGEVRRRAADNPDDVTDRLDTDRALFQSTEADFGDSFTARRGGSELPGLFTSPDASPLRLDFGDDSSTGLRLPRASDFTGGDDRLAAFPGDRIEGAPRRAAESRRARDPDTGDFEPDPTTGGAQFLDQEAERGTAFVRPTGDRTTELESIFPPGSQFRRTDEIAVELPSGRAVPLQVFRRGDSDRIDAPDVDGDGSLVSAREVRSDLSRRGRADGDPVTPVPTVGSPTTTTTAPRPAGQTTTSFTDARSADADTTTAASQQDVAVTSPGESAGTETSAGTSPTTSTAPTAPSTSSSTSPSGPPASTPASSSSAPSSPGLPSGGPFSSSGSTPSGSSGPFGSSSPGGSSGGGSGGGGGGTSPTPLPPTGNPPPTGRGQLPDPDGDGDDEPFDALAVSSNTPDFTDFRDPLTGDVIETSPGLPALVDENQDADDGGSFLGL